MNIMSKFGINFIQENNKIILYNKYRKGIRQVKNILIVTNLLYQQIKIKVYEDKNKSYKINP